MPIIEPPEAKKETQLGQEEKCNLPIPGTDTSRQSRIFRAGIYSALTGILITAGALTTHLCTRDDEYGRQIAKVSHLSSEVFQLTQARNNTINLFEGKTLADLTNTYQTAIVSREEEIKNLKRNPKYQNKNNFQNGLYYVGIIGGATLGYAGLIVAALTRKR